jgi:hypothetical protein
LAALPLGEFFSQRRAALQSLYVRLQEQIDELDKVPASLCRVTDQALYLQFLHQLQKPFVGRRVDASGVRHPPFKQQTGPLVLA